MVLGGSRSQVVLFSCGGWAGPAGAAGRPLARRAGECAVVGQSHQLALPGEAGDMAVELSRVRGPTGAWERGVTQAGPVVRSGQGSEASVRGDGRTGRPVPGPRAGVRGAQGPPQAPHGHWQGTALCAAPLGPLSQPGERSGVRGGGWFVWTSGQRESPHKSSFYNNLNKPSRSF